MKVTYLDAATTSPSLLGTVTPTKLKFVLFDGLRGKGRRRLNLYGAGSNWRGLYIPIQTHCPVVEEPGAQSNRCLSTVGKHLSALAPKADMPHRQQRLTERAGKGPCSIRHNRLFGADIEIRSLSFVWAVCAW